MKTPFLVFFSIVLLNSISGLAQELIKIEGKVTNSDSLPIPFVHIYISDQSIGTVTNEDGIFRLTLDGKYIKSTLIFSAVGYKNTEIPIMSVNHKRVSITLTDAIKKLDEIEIRPAFKDSAKIILFKALSKIKQNYSSKLYFLNGFYREVSYKDTTATRLIEAAIRINSKGYKFDDQTFRVKKMKIDVEQVRKSNDYRTYTLWDKFSRLLFGKENSLYKVFKEDYVRFLNSKGIHFLSKESLNKYYTYNIENILIKENDTVFIIKASSETPLTLRNLKFYINKEDWAFLKIEHSLLFNYKSNKFPSQEISPLIISATATYRKYKNKYYLNLINVISYSNGATGILPNYQMQFDHLQFMTNNIYVKSDPEFERIKRKDSESNSENIYSINQEYDKSFWENYNMILFSPLDTLITHSLEKNEPLNSQFKKNDH